MQHVETHDARTHVRGRRSVSEANAPPRTRSLNRGDTSDLEDYPTSEATPRCRPLQPVCDVGL